MVKLFAVTLFIGENCRTISSTLPSISRLDNELSSPLKVNWPSPKENFPYSAGATSNVVENGPPNANRNVASTGDLFFAAINSGCVSSLFTKFTFAAASAGMTLPCINIVMGNGPCSTSTSNTIFWPGLILRSVHRYQMSFAFENGN